MITSNMPPILITLLIHHHLMLFVTIPCIISVWFMTFKKINDVSCQFEKSVVFWGTKIASQKAKGEVFLWIRTSPHLSHHNRTKPKSSCTVVESK